jgi:hypothetical protein
MPARASVHVRRLREEQARAEKTIRELSGSAMVGAMRQSTMLVQATAKKEAKVDMGGWRASITPEVSVFGNVVRGVVGSSLEHAPFAHEDTKPHWAPIVPIFEWVKRKGLAVQSGVTYDVKTRKRVNAVQSYLDAVYQIARAVQRKIARYGTKGDHAIDKGLERNMSRIVHLIERAVDKAVEG